MALSINALLHPKAQAPVQAALAQHLLHSRPIAVHRHVLTIAGNPAAGILLSQLVYWTRRGIGVAEQDGWVHKTAEQWERETGLSWKIQRRARAYLIEANLMQERAVGAPRRIEFRLNLNEFARRTSELIQVQLQADYVSLDLFRTEDIVVKQLLGNAMSYHRLLARLTPHINDALLLSRLIHDQRQIGRWIVRTRTDWLRELCMSRDEWETARRHLRDMGVLIERHGNFPRRVNLLVDQDKLVMALNRLAQGHFAKPQPKARQRSTSPTAKRVQVVDSSTVGGFGRFCTAGIPTSESPNPAYPNPAYPKAAFTGSPKPPAQIAQSPLYLNSEGLQGSLQPQLQPQSEERALGEPAVGVVVDEKSVSKQVQVLPHGSPKAAQPEGGPARATPGAASVDRPIPPEVNAPSDLIYPSFISIKDQASIRIYLERLPCSIAQDLLDEVEWSHSRKGVASPVGLVRHLAGLVEKGEFQAEGAHIVQERRARRKQSQEQQSRLMQAAVASPTVHAAAPQTTAAAPAPSQHFSPIREHLRQVTERMRAERNAAQLLGTRPRGAR